MAVQSRRKNRPPPRSLRKSRNHLPARPRGGWVMVLDPVDGSIGLSILNRPLVESGVLGNKLNLRPVSQSSVSGARLLFGI